MRATRSEGTSDLPGARVEPARALEGGSWTQNSSAAIAMRRRVARPVAVSSPRQRRAEVVALTLTRSNRAAGNLVVEGELDRLREREKNSAWRRMKTPRPRSSERSSATRESSRASRSAPSSGADEALLDERVERSRSASQTASAASSVQPPAKTASRARTARCSSAEAVRPFDRRAQRGWRGSASRPAFSRSRRLARRSKSCAGESIFGRAAASSTRQRQVVEAGAESAIRRPAKSGCTARGAREEELDGLGFGKAGTGDRRPRPRGEAFATRHEQVELGAAARNAELGGRLDHCSKLSEQEQHSAVRDLLGERVGHRAPGPPIRAELAGSRKGARHPRTRRPGTTRDPAA